MTISMSEQAYDDLCQDEQQCQYPDPDDLDVVYQQPQCLSKGYVREIELRQGLELEIENYRLRDRWDFSLPERESWLTYHFHLSGEHQDRCTNVSNRQYALYGSGLAPKEVIVGSDKYPILEVTIYMQPAMLRSFTNNLQGQLPAEFQPLIRQPDQERYTRVGAILPAMQRVLWQILRCPYQGMTKRMCLEGKALKVVALLLEQEAEIQKGQPQQVTLEPEQRDRIYHAREILLQRLDNPPTLMDLARRQD